MRVLLTHILQQDPRVEIIGTVNDGQAAIDFLERRERKPDVVIMDIHMPRLDGFEATRRIMETMPLPIVICTATADPQELQVAFRTMEAGAVACVEKPVGPADPEFETRSQHLRQTICLMAEVKVVPTPGHVYIAPDDFHLGVSPGHRLHLSHDPPEQGLRPSVSWLFRALAQSVGANAIGVLLTGMGRDGADELKLMRDRGATTIAQDRDSSVVHGMPGEAIAIGAAIHVLAADHIAGALITEVARRLPNAGGVES